MAGVGGGTYVQRVVRDGGAGKHAVLVDQAGAAALRGQAARAFCVVVEAGDDVARGRALEVFGLLAGDVGFDLGLLHRNKQARQPQKQNSAGPHDPLSSRSSNNLPAVSEGFGDDSAPASGVLSQPGTSGSRRGKRGRDGRRQALLQAAKSRPWRVFFSFCFWV